jgi:hypothetical protein
VRRSEPTKSHVAAWTLSVLAVPLFYIISVPPYAIYTDRTVAPSLDPFAPLPSAKSHYSQPYLWLHDNTALKAPLTAYEQMCSKIAARWF